MWFEVFVITILSLNSLWFLILTGGAKRKINTTKQLAAQSERNAVALARTVESLETELSQTVLGKIDDFRAKKTMVAYPEIMSVERVTEALCQDSATARSLIADALRRTPSVISRHAVIDALVSSQDSVSVNEVVQRAIKDEIKVIPKDALRQAVAESAEHPLIKWHVEQVLMENSTLSQVLVKGYAIDHLSAHDWENVGEDEPYKTDGGTLVHLRTEQCHYCRAVNRMWTGAPPSKIKDAEGFFVNGKRWQGDGMPPCLHIAATATKDKA